MASLAAGLTALHVWLAEQVPKDTFLGIVRQLLPVIGIGLVFPVTAAGCLATDVTILSLYGHLLRAFFYPHTPLSVLDGSIAIVAAGLAVRRLHTVARSVEFWFPIILGLLLIVVILSVPHIKYCGALRPSGHFVIRPWIRATIGTWFLYANGGLVATLTSHVRWRHARAPYRLAVGAVLMQSAILFLFYAIGLITLGPTALSKLLWPVVYIFTLVSTPTFLVQSLGLLILMTFTVTTVLYLAVHLFCFGWSVWSAWAKPPAWIRSATVFGGTTVLWVGAIQIPSTLADRWWLFHWINPWTLGWTLLSAGALGALALPRTSFPRGGRRP
jgi:hypothetical protein